MVPTLSLIQLISYIQSFSPPLWITCKDRILWDGSHCVVYCTELYAVNECFLQKVFKTNYTVNS